MTPSILCRRFGKEEMIDLNYRIGVKWIGEERMGQAYSRVICRSPCLPLYDSSNKHINYRDFRIDRWNVIGIVVMRNQSSNVVH